MSVATWLLSHHPDPPALIDRALDALSPDGRLLIMLVTNSDRWAARLGGWRLRRLHSEPVDLETVFRAEPTYTLVSARGLVVVAEFSGSRVGASAGSR